MQPSRPCYVLLSTILVSLALFQNGQFDLHRI